MSLEKLALTIRLLSAEAVEKAKSGHPGMPLGAADFASVLWAKHLRFSPNYIPSLAKDNFVLSAGHGSMLLYSLLHVFGYKVSIDDLKSFRQWESKTPGHPEFGFTDGVETTTGPLGQGFANGVGLALSKKLFAARYGNLFEGRVFGIVSDGDLMEGISYEAASIAGHLKLGNLTYLYDDNHITIGGTTEIIFTEDPVKRFEAAGWHVQRVDGHNVKEIDAAIEKANALTDKPSIICCRTTIGYGSPHKSNDPEVHGSPLGTEELLATKKQLCKDFPDWKIDQSFYVPDEVRNFCAEIVKANEVKFKEWEQKFAAWKTENPELAKTLDNHINKRIPDTFEAELLEVLQDGKKDATRNISGKALQVVSKHCPWVIGGSADLEPSNKSLIKGVKDVQPTSFEGKNIRFGIREHAMGAISNGLTYTGFWAPYSAGFLVFSDYMRTPIRLAALSHLQSLYVFTHDSFWVGEDGPTHQPIEHIQSLRLIPNLYVWRPADATEVAVSYTESLRRKNGPSALLFTRQNLPQLVSKRTIEDIKKGGYVVESSLTDTITIVATGSEVALAVDSATLLKKEGINASVVSIPCLEIFNQQSKEYKEKIIPKNTKKVFIEAGITTGWEAVVGSDALMIGIDHYGASAPGEVLAEKFGFTPESVVAKIKDFK